MRKLLLIAAILSVGFKYDPTTICEAIYKAEGSEAARQPYGIETIACNSRFECRNICRATVRKRYRSWVMKGSPGDFVNYLAKKYCPRNKQVWSKNVRFFLRKKSS